MTGSRLAAAVVVVLVVLAGTPGIVTASVNGSPEIDVSLPDGTVSPGEVVSLEFELANDATLDQTSLSNPELASEVTTARGVAVTVESGDAPLSVDTGRRLLGSIEDGDLTTVDYDVTVADDAESGTYDLDVTVSYSHATSVSEAVGAVSERTVTRRFDVEVTVEREDVRFRVVDSETTIRAGETDRLAVTVEHAGQEPARDASVRLRSLDPAVRPADGEASRYVGDWPAGDRRTLTYRVSAGSGASPEPSALELVTRYEDGAGTEQTATPLSIGVAPLGGQRFRTESEASPLSVGGDGAVGVAITNTGPGPAESVRVNLAASSPAVSVDGGDTGRRVVDRVPAGSTRVATFDVAVVDSARGGNYSLSATATYDDATGATVTGDPQPVAVRVAPAPTFSLGTTTNSLYVGEPGTLAGTVVNDADRPVQNAVLTVTETPAAVRVVEQRYALGTLAAGESAEYELPVSVANTATAGPRAVSFTVEYETSDGTRGTSDQLRSRAEVSPERDSFRLEPLNATFAPDTTDQLRVRLTNARNETRTDVRATLTPAPPFTSPAPSAYVGELAPGESTIVRFAVDTDEDAITAEHALAVNVTADTDDGRTERERHRVAMDVETNSQPDDIAPVVILGILSVAILGGAGWWWYEHR